MSLIYQGYKVIVKKVEICKINNHEVVLGQGGQATVYKAMLTLLQEDKTERQIDIALKRIALPKCNIVRQRISELIKREQSVYRSIKSPNIIKLYGTNLNFLNKKLEDLEYLDFYFELCDGSLAELIKDKDKGIDVPLREDIALEIFESVVEVEFLLEQSFFLRSSKTFKGLFHRDINIKNILYKKKKHKIQVKVCDFGIANYAPDQENQIFLTQKIGTNSFTSPENQLQQQYELEKNESWSLGILLFCLLKGLSYFKSVLHLFNNNDDHHKLIEKMQLQSYTKELLIKLLKNDPSKRWDYDDLKNSKWYTAFGSKKCKILQRIEPVLKFRQKCFNELSLQIIEYNQLIEQNKLQFLEFQIPQDLLLITIKSYELWSWKQLEKYSGSYCYEYQNSQENAEQLAVKDEIKQYETNLIKITQELRVFFFQITQHEDQQNQKQQLENQQHKNQQLENQQNQNQQLENDKNKKQQEDKDQENEKQKKQQVEDAKNIRQFWSQIICKTTKTYHFTPDALHYYMHLFEEMEQKLISRLKIFSIYTDENVLNNKLKVQDKIQGQIVKLQTICNTFEQTVKEKKIQFEKLEQYYNLTKSSANEEEKKKKEFSEFQNWDNNTISKNRNQLKEDVDELQFQVDECTAAKNQQQQILQFLKQKKQLQEMLEKLKKIQQQFNRYFYWKKEEEYLQIFKSND